MHPLAVGLALGAAVLHAVWNRALHDAGDREAALAVAGLVGGTLLLPALVLHPPARALGLVAASGVAETAYAICLAAAYRRGELALAYPLGRGAAPLLVTLGGWAALNERPDIAGVAGALALGSGLALLAASGRRAKQAEAVAFALLAGVAIAAYSVVDAAAARRVSPTGYLSAVLLLQGLLLTAGLRFDGMRLRRSARVGAWIGVGGLAAYLLVLAAFRLAKAGDVATLREVSVLLVVLLSPRRRDPRVWAAAGLVAAGAALVAV